MSIAVAAGGPSTSSGQARAEPRASSPFLRKFTKLLCGCVVVLIFAGAMVTSHGAGLSVPDWPTSYGRNMFLFPPSLWVGGIFYEHVHRLIASVIGMLTIVLVVAMYRLEPRRWVRVLSYVALAAVILQGLLGGLTVLLRLPAAVSVAHALLAQTFFVLTIVIAYAESKELAERGADGGASRAFFAWALIAAGAVYLQLFFGAVMRHTESGLAIPDFPTTAGSIIPSISDATLARAEAMRSALGIAGDLTTGQVAVHLLHRFWAFIVAAVILRLAMFSAPAVGERARASAQIAAVLVVVQFSLGVLTVQSLRNPVVTSLHVMLGAVLLGISAVAALRAWGPRSGR